MTSILPLPVTGQNLGERHRLLNHAVAAHTPDHLPFQSVLCLPEETPVDHLFKIKLASRYRDRDYIISQLQHDDLLYVSKALRAPWLVEEDIINPSYLEQVLYPKMTAPAVSKLRSWLYTHLRDPSNCRLFYQHYKDATFEYAIKFLWRCSNDFILDEAPKILEKLTPRYLKMLCETCPRVAKVFFDSIETSRKVRLMYLNDQKKYYESIKPVLKPESEIFLDITEKYFNLNYFDKLSKVATRHIMRQQRGRFDRKAELYTMWLLDMGTLAQELSGDECEQLVLRLARAEYLHHLFSYKFIEPLIKRLDKDKRAALKKNVFVDKDVGDKVKDWPYDTPSQPNDSEFDVRIFEDRKHSIGVFNLHKRLIKKKYCGSFKRCDYVQMSAECSMPVVTLLNKLYDEFRYSNFERTFFELKKRMKTESSAQNRQYMMIVLVSKSASNAESVETLLKYLNKHHSNEPVQVRAAVVRSVAKRACGWRLPTSTWQQLLAFSRGLGLDGTPAESPCIEGLHSAVLRHLLEPSTCPSQLVKAFLENFSTFKEYSLNGAEKKVVIDRLLKLLLTSIDVETDPKAIVQQFDYVLDTLSAYKLRSDTCKILASTVAKFAEAHASAAENLLQRLFREKIARRELFKQNFTLIKTDASYVNALRHNTEVLDVNVFVNSLTKNNLKPEQFLRKLTVYFSEPNGLANTFLAALTMNVGLEDVSNCEKHFARPIVYLAGAKIEEILKTFGASLRGSTEAHLAAAMKVNVHVARPRLDLEAFGWRRAGARAVVTRVVMCRAEESDKETLRLASWRRTARAALAMTTRASEHYELFSAVVAVRPKAILQVAVPFFQHHYPCDPRILNIVESALGQVDVSENLQLCKKLLYFKSIAAETKAKYCTVLYKCLKNVKYSKQFKNFKEFDRRTLLAELVNNILFVDDTFIEGLILDFINSDIMDDGHDSEMGSNEIIPVYMSMIAKYLLLCKTENDQKARLKIIGEPFFKKMGVLATRGDDMKSFLRHLDEFLLHLKYMKVFLDPEYVSCLPVMERVAEWMKEVLPQETGFQRFVHLHISMLLFKSVRQCVKQAPDVFSDVSRRQEEGVNILGRVLGQYIAHEVVLLTEKYFNSIVELYRTALIRYIEDYFEWDLDYLKARLVKPLVMGILESAEGKNNCLPVHLVIEYTYNFDDKMKNELRDFFKDKASEECKFLTQTLNVFDN